MSKLELTEEQRQDLRDAAGIVDGAQSGDDNEADRWFARLAQRLRVLAGAVRFKDGDVVEDLVHGWKYRLFNVDSREDGVHAHYVVVEGEHVGWDSRKDLGLAGAAFLPGFFPYAHYSFCEYETSVAKGA